MNTSAEGEATRRPFRVRTAATPEDRRRILRTLFPASGSRSNVWFAVLMALSVIIALMGLSLGRHMARAAAAVVVASAGAIALSWAITWLLPISDRVLTSEAP